MDNIACAVPRVDPAQLTTSWPVAGLLLDALTRRDFAAMRALFTEDVRFRALVPPGLLALSGAEATAERFATWFGGEDDFEVLDASVSQVGERQYARWRVRMSPPGRPGDGRVAEQHVFTTGADRIGVVDLLCSGFQRDPR